jgi:hypothetical protein
MNLGKPSTCRICLRPLGKGDTVLGWTRRKGPMRAFRCVDTEDCDGVVKLGRWPAAQPRILALADALDAGFKISRR